MEYYINDLNVVRFLFQRGLAALYFVAFLSAFNQLRILIGEKGLLPVPDFLEKVSFIKSPTVFKLYYSDRFLTACTLLGIILSIVAFTGLSESGPLWISVLLWLLLWVLYLSIVNAGQIFYGFGWESMLLEACFFASFLGPFHMETSFIPVYILRWMLFRVEMGAGLIKIRHDQCWRDLTCLFYHYETQPLPNPLSWYFHHLPGIIHRAGVVFSHFVQLIVPFGLFAPQPTASIAGAFIIIHQLFLIVSGNYSWLNWLTVVLGITAFSDNTLAFVTGAVTIDTVSRPFVFDIFLYFLGAVTLALSIQPTLNLFSKRQRMNFSYNPLHLVNTYGAFGTVTKDRYEIVIEGTDDTEVSPGTEWKEYEFRGKPVDPYRRPPQVAPYHLRLDWMIWFLPFTVSVTTRGISMYGYELWYLRFIRKLLEGDENTTGLLRNNPFKDSPPNYVRARFYRYSFTSPEEKRKSGAWWNRELIDEYMPPVSLSDLNF